MSSERDLLSIRCPFCNSEYSIERHEYGRKATCAVCGKNFVIGQVPNKQPDHQYKKSFCTTCGRMIDANAVLCSHCGKPVLSENAIVEQPISTPFSTNKSPEKDKDIKGKKTNIVVPVILTVLSCSSCFLCMPIPALIGVASIIFAAQAHLKLNKGDMSGAAKVKLISDILIMIGFGLCILGWLIFGILQYEARHPNSGNLSTYIKQ